jgi:gamma-glutamyl phosphate reductase
MTATVPPSLRALVPRVRQEVVDQLMAHLLRDDTDGFAAAEQSLGATRAEVAAASAGLIESRQLDLGALEHALEVLGDVARLPDPAAHAA